MFTNLDPYESTNKPMYEESAASVVGAVMCDIQKKETESSHLVRQNSAFVISEANLTEPREKDVQECEVAFAHSEDCGIYERVPIRTITNRMVVTCKHISDYAHLVEQITSFDIRPYAKPDCTNKVVLKMIRDQAFMHFAISLRGIVRKKITWNGIGNERPTEQAMQPSLQTKGGREIANTGRDTICIGDIVYLRPLDETKLNLHALVYGTIASQQRRPLETYTIDLGAISRTVADDDSPDAWEKFLNYVAVMARKTAFCQATAAAMPGSYFTCTLL